MPLNTGISVRDNSTCNVQFIRKTVTFTDTTAVAITIGKIPAGSLIINAGAYVSTAFNNGTNNLLNIGTTADDDGLATVISLATVGLIVWDEFATSDDLLVAADTTLIATPSVSGTAATTGSADVFVTYLARK